MTAESETVVEALGYRTKADPANNLARDCLHRAVALVHIASVYAYREHQDRDLETLLHSAADDIDKAIKAIDPRTEGEG